MIRFVLQSERLGPLPLVNHFIQRMGLEDTLDQYVLSDQRCAVSHARALGVLPRSIIVERENRPSCREMAWEIHSKLPLQPAESKPSALDWVN